MRSTSLENAALRSSIKPYDIKKALLLPSLSNFSKRVLIWIHFVMMFSQKLPGLISAPNYVRYLV